MTGTRQKHLFFFFAIICTCFATISMERAHPWEQPSTYSRVSTLRQLAANKFIQKIYGRFEGNKEQIETFLINKFVIADYKQDCLQEKNLDEILKKWLHFLDNKEDIDVIAPIYAPYMAVDLAKQYFYIYADPNIAQHKRTEQFLNIGVNYGFSIQELIDNNQLPSIIEGDDFSDVESEADYLYPLLDLSYLKIESLKGLNNIPNISTIKSLILDRNQLEFIYKDSFSNLNSLEILNLNNNKISLIEPNAFSKTIVSLYLSGNLLRYIDESMFNGTDNLEVLHLSNNYINQIEPNAFASILKLEDLYLNSNELKKIKPSIFRKGPRSLMSLGLTNNQINHISDFAFKSLTELDTLFLEKNKISEVNQNTFSGLSNLTYLFLQNNKIKHLTKNSLEIFNNDIKINLENNPISFQELNELANELPQISFII